MTQLHARAVAITRALRHLRLPAAGLVHPAAHDAEERTSLRKRCLRVVHKVVPVGRIVNRKSILACLIYNQVSSVKDRASYVSVVSLIGQSPGDPGLTRESARESSKSSPPVPESSRANPRACPGNVASVPRLSPNVPRQPRQSAPPDAESSPPVSERSPSSSARSPSRSLVCLTTHRVCPATFSRMWLPFGRVWLPSGRKRRRSTFILRR
jgi:hypothetical protein